MIQRTADAINTAALIGFAALVLSLPVSLGVLVVLGGVAR